MNPSNAVSKMNRPARMLLQSASILALLSLGASAQVGNPLSNPVVVSGGSGTAADGTAFIVESVPGTAASAVGTDSVAIGDGAVAGDAAGDNGVLAIGASATATGPNSIAIGQNADATGISSIAIGGDTTDGTSADATATNAIAIGRNAITSGIQGVAIGNNASAGSASSNAVAIGESANANHNGAIGIGLSATASEQDTISVGTNSDATAAEALAIGDTAQATGAKSIAIGNNVDASGANCIAIGSNATDAQSADCSAASSLALGQAVLANDIGEFIFGSGQFAAQSDAHTSIFVLRNNTTDATQTELFADGSAADISVPSDCTVTFNALITARQTDADNVSAGYSFFGVMDNNAGTTALVGSLSAITTIGEDVAGWDVTASADDTADGINILVTGAVGDAVRWVARVEVVEVCG